MIRPRNLARTASIVAGLLLFGLAGVATAETLSHRLHGELEEFVRARADSRVNRFEIPDLAAFDQLGFAAEGVELSLRTRRVGRLIGRVPVTVILKRGDSELKRGVVTVRLRAVESVMVANRGLSRGEVVGAQDFRRASRDVSDLRSPPITQASDLLGMRVRQSIQAGNVWQPRHLETVPVVKRGERVRLRLVSGGLQIDGAGKAGEDGRAGDWIRVLNDASRRYVTGQVDEEGTVHVRF